MDIIPEYVRRVTSLERRLQKEIGEASGILPGELDDLSITEIEKRIGLSMEAYDSSWRNRSCTS